MKELFEVEFKVTTKVSASPLAKGVVEPLTIMVQKAIPLLERVAEGVIKSLEKEAEK